MGAKNAYISHRFHTRLEPSSFYIGKCEFDSNPFQPPGRGLCEFPLNVADQERLLVDPRFS